MLRKTTIAIALATAATIAGTGAADAATCSCAVHHHRHHATRHHHRRTTTTTTVRSATTATARIPTTTTAIDPAPSAYIAKDSMYLPDPQHDDHPTWIATSGEIAAASALNATLDRWTACGWKGDERDAASFVAWSRTHLVRDRAGDIEPAWKPFGYASARRVAYSQDGVFNSTNLGCDVTVPERSALMAEMDHQADALERAHLAGHAGAHATPAATAVTTTTTTDYDSTRTVDVSTRGR